MIHNDALPRIEVDPETYEVRADGELLTCEPARVLPMAQRYFSVLMGGPEMAPQYPPTRGPIEPWARSFLRTTRYSVGGRTRLRLDDQASARPGRAEVALITSAPRRRCGRRIWLGGSATRWC